MRTHGSDPGSRRDDEGSEKSNGMSMSGKAPSRRYAMIDMDQT